jgi:hypothetical protein
VDQNGVFYHLHSGKVAIHFSDGSYQITEGSEHLKQVS